MNILRRQPKMILRLDDLSTLNDELVEACNLTKADRGYAYDHDMEMLLDDSGITVGNKIDVEREFQYDNDYEPVGCNYGDYLETVELFQDDVKYLCRAYMINNGNGAEYGLDLAHVVRVARLIREPLTAEEKLNLILVFHDCYYNTDQDTNEFASEYYNLVELINGGIIPLELEHLVHFEDYIVEAVPRLAHYFY